MSTCINYAATSISNSLSGVLKKHYLYKDKRVNTGICWYIGNLSHIQPTELLNHHITFCQKLVNRLMERCPLLIRFLHFFMFLSVLYSRNLENDSYFFIFLAHLYKVQVSYCCQHKLGIHVHIGFRIKFLVKFLQVYISSSLRWIYLILFLLVDTGLIMTHPRDLQVKVMDFEI